MRSILLVGLDEDLLRTRAAVLARTGWPTVYATAADALAVQEQRQADLVVLCHSVPVSAANVLTQAIRERWRETRIILVQKRSAANLETAVEGVDAVSYSDPERLLGCATELMGLGTFARREALTLNTTAYLN